MNDIMKQNCFNLGTEALKNADIKFSLEGWPCTVSVLGICTTVSFITWIKTRNTALPTSDSITQKNIA